MSNFYFYSAVIPLLITAICLWFFRPLSFKRIVRGLTINAIPLMFYMLFLYFLEMQEYVKSGWSFYTVLFFYILYLIIVGILNLINLTVINRNNLN